MIKTLMIRLLFLIIAVLSFSFAQEEYTDTAEGYNDGYPSYYEYGGYPSYYEYGGYEYYEEDTVSVEDGGSTEEAVVTVESEEIVEPADDTSESDEDNKPTSKTNVLIPLFQNYRLPERVDSQNPELPYTHTLKRLRGTVWRGSEEVFRPNTRGVVATYRLFIFFDKNRDAIAYKYIPYKSRRNPEFPRMEEFYPLIPLLQTNDFVPITSQSLLDVSKELITNKDVSSELWIDPAFAENENIEEEIQFQESEPVQSDSDDIANVEDQTDAETDAEGDNYEYEEGYQEGYEYYEGGYEYGESYEGAVSALFYLPQTMLAQSIQNDSLNPNQFVINVGGDQAGIFVHKTNDPNTPYKVIFLSFDGSMTLYEYNINNSFDVRDTTTESSRRARELYINILENKINMKKFQRVIFPANFIDF